MTGGVARRLVDVPDDPLAEVDLVSFLHDRIDGEGIVRDRVGQGVDLRFGFHELGNAEVDEHETA